VNIVFYGRRCVCYSLTLKIICTSRICISNHIMSNSKCDRALGLPYASHGLYAPWGTFYALYGSFVFPGALVCPLPPCVRASPTRVHSPSPLPMRTLGLFYAPWASFMPPWNSCVHPPSPVCALSHACTPPMWARPPTCTCPFLTCAPPGAILCPLGLLYAPPPTIRAPLHACVSLHAYAPLLPPIHVRLPPLHVCALGLFYAPWSSYTRPLHPCALPFMPTALLPPQLVCILFLLLVCVGALLSPLELFYAPQGSFMSPGALVSALLHPCAPSFTHVRPFSCTPPFTYAHPPSCVCAPPPPLFRSRPTFTHVHLLNLLQTLAWKSTSPLLMPCQPTVLMWNKT
jgi:hypothetical protein